MIIKNRFGMLGTLLVCSLLVLASGCNKRVSVTDVSSPKAPTIGTEVDDTIVTSRVKAALLADPVIKGFDIKVETNKGEVMLSGFVDNQTQLERSIVVAKGAEGVKSVNNMLALKNGVSTVGNKIDDGVVTAKVKSALLAAEDLKSMDISVVTNKGDVQLSGFVDSTGQIARALEVTQNVEGVKTVINQLSVKK